MPQSCYSLYELFRLAVNSRNVVYTQSARATFENCLGFRKSWRGNADPAGACWPGSLAQRSRTASVTALAASWILTGPASQNILFWTASIGHPRQLLPAWPYLLHPCSRARSPLIHQSTRRFEGRPTSKPPPRPYDIMEFESEKLSSAGGVCGLFIRRGKGSARGDFQGENRGPTVHDHRDVGGRAMSGTIAEDVPPAWSRSGGFLTEGSPQGRIGIGRIHHPRC